MLYIIDYLSPLYKSKNEIVDEFIRNRQNFNDVFEFISYDQFKDIEFCIENEFSKIYKATWIDGNIQYWDDNIFDFKRSGTIQIFLKRLNNSENITYNELDMVSFNLIII